MSKPCNANLSPLRRCPLHHLAHPFDGMHDQRVTRTKANVFTPVLEFVHTDDLLDIWIALERLGLGLENHVRTKLCGFGLERGSLAFHLEIKWDGFVDVVVNRGENCVLQVVVR